MTKITVTVSDELYRRVRARAAELGVPVSAVVREFLTRWSAEGRDCAGRKRLQDETLRSVRTFRAGDRLSRDAVHERTS